jgi:CRP/FNR family transcriptional regulator
MGGCLCENDGCVLCEAQLFSGLTEEHVCKIQSLLSRHSYKTHEALFLEGEPSDRLFVLRSGQVKLTTSLPDGREQILRLSVVGHIVGLETLKGGDYPYTATAVLPTEACTIRHKDLLKILEANPAVSMRTIQTLSEELEKAQQLIRDLGLKSAPERVASFILSLVPPRVRPNGEIMLALTRHEIAEMLGLTVETVSRVMAELKREEIIEAPRGHLRILDNDKLKKMAGIADYSYRQVN